MPKELNHEQKIDYIYNYLKKKRLSSIFKWIIRLFILGLIIHFYFFVLPTMNKDEIVKQVGNKIIDIVAPIVEKTVNSINMKKIEEKKKYIDNLEKNNINTNNKG